MREVNECVKKTLHNYRNFKQNDFEILLKSKDWNHFDHLNDPNLEFYV